MAPLQLTVQHPDFDTVQVSIEGSLDLARAYDFDDAMRRIERDAPGRSSSTCAGWTSWTPPASRAWSRSPAVPAHGAPARPGQGVVAVQRLFAVTAMNEHFEVVGDPAELLATA